MAGEASTPTSTPHELQCEAFVRYYYNRLCNFPQIVDTLYSRSMGKLTRAEAGADGRIETAVTRPEIHEKILSWDLSDAEFELFTVDCQESKHIYKGYKDVQVMVTGALSTSLSGRRKFVQSFLVVETALETYNGYTTPYKIVHDIFRYLDGEPGYVLVETVEQKVVEEPAA